MTAGVSGTATGDVGTAVVTIVGAALFVVLGARLTYLALRTRSSVTTTEAAIWEYFAFAGLVATLYGGLVLTGLWTARTLPFLPGLLLAFALCFALAMREVYYNATLANAEVDRLGEFHLRRALEVGFVCLVVVVAIGPMLGAGRSGTILGALAGVAVVAYGLYFQHRRTKQVATRGTLLDSLVRHSVPVLVFAGAGIVTPSLALGTTSEQIARALAAVFVLATATSLLGVAIKLQQHRAAHA